MAYGDTYFSIVSSGSNATAAAGKHGLFGSYSGLSLINQNDVIHINLVPTAADIRVWDTTVSNDVGLRLTTAGSVFDLPPMRVGAASLLNFSRDAAVNATVNWTVWRRTSGNA